MLKLNMSKLQVIGVLLSLAGAGLNILNNQHSDKILDDKIQKSIAEALKSVK